MCSDGMQSSSPATGQLTSLEVPRMILSELSGFSTVLSGWTVIRVRRDLRTVLVARVVLIGVEQVDEPVGLERRVHCDAEQPDRHSC